MKLSKLFHTLYATVMALPVLIIPIFALNILHKETEPISIEVQEKLSVDFNQLRGDYTERSFNEYGVTITTNGEGFVLNGTNTGTGGRLSYYNSLLPKTFDIISGHKYYVQTYRTGTQNLILYINNANTSAAVYGGYYNNAFLTANQSFTANIGFNFGSLNMTFEDYIVRVNIYDLTKMNMEDITEQEFVQYFPNQYYPYTESKKMLMNKPSPTTYNDTDIGSQFVYALYKPVHDYFNFGEFFGLGGMYDWFQLNIFNGTSPLSFFIVFNVMIYWLFISLFWLLFDILIYVPMVIHKWLDKAEM